MDKKNKKIDLMLEETLGANDIIEAEIIKIDIESPNQKFDPLEYPTSEISGEIATSALTASGTQFTPEIQTKFTEVIEKVKNSEPYFENFEISITLKKGFKFKFSKGFKNQTKHTIIKSS